MISLKLWNLHIMEYTSSKNTLCKISISVLNNVAVNFDCLRCGIYATFSCDNVVVVLHVNIESMNDKATI